MIRILKILILILSFHSISFADQKNLDQLFQKLIIENNQNIARNIEDQIWKL